MQHESIVWNTLNIHAHFLSAFQIYFIIDKFELLETQLVTLVRQITADYKFHPMADYLLSVFLLVISNLSLNRHRQLVTPSNVYCSAQHNRA